MPRLSIALSDVPRLDPKKELICASGVTLVLERTSLDKPPAVIRSPAPDELRALIAAVDGQRTLAEICELLEEDYDPESVVALFQDLHGKIFSVSREDFPRASLAGRLTWIGNGPLVERLRASVDRSTSNDRLLLLDGLDTRSEEELAAIEAAAIVPGNRALRLHGSRSDTVLVRPSLAALAEALRGDALVICALEEAPLWAVIDVNRACLAAGVLALFVTSDADGITVGPAVVPWRSACFECARLHAAFSKQPIEGGGAALLGLSTGSIPEAAEVILPRAAALLAGEVSRIGSGAEYPHAFTRLIRLSELGGRAELDVALDTSCSSCAGGNPRGAGAAWSPPPYLPLDRERELIADRTSGVRSVSTEEARSRAHAAAEKLALDVALDAYSGRLLGRYPELKQLPYYLRVSIGRRFDPSAPVLLRRVMTNIFGKGITRDQALCSGLFELFERQLAEYRGGVELVRAPYAQVREHAVNMELFTEGLLPHHDRGPKVEFAPERELDWVWGQDLRKQRAILIPAAALFVSGTFRGSELHLPWRGSSGIAAGCTREDAILQGLYEVVEHDAWFATGRTGAYCPALDLDTVEDAPTREVIEKVRRAGFKLQVRVLTNEIGIPVFEAYATSERDLTYFRSPGYGCHHDPAIALRRAILETIQNVGAADWTTQQTVLDGYFSVFNSFHDTQFCTGRVRGTLRWDQISRPPESWTRVSDYLDHAIEQLGRAIPKADVCWYDFSSPALEGVHVTCVFVTGVYDTYGHTPFVPSRLLQYRRSIEGPEAPELSLEDLYLGRLKT